jgi:hypothetical protein
MSKTGTMVSWGLQLLVAGILLQTLFFKFTAAEESVYIFSTIGAEPWGRIASGVLELAAALLLLTPAYAPYGAILTMGAMSGAILTHLTVLGIEVKGDGGLLFGLALTALAGSLIVLLIRRSQIPFIGRYGSMAANTCGTASIMRARCWVQSWAETCPTTPGCVAHESNSTRSSRSRTSSVSASSSNRSMRRLSRMQSACLRSRTATVRRHASRARSAGSSRS